jgi:hypothetical protein
MHEEFRMTSAWRFGRRELVGILAMVVAAASTNAAGIADEEPGPLKIIILAGQSNMEGQAVVDLKGKDYNEGKGTLLSFLNDPAKAPTFKHLRRSDGTWAVRDDVWVRYQREAGPLLAGPLTMGFTSYGDPHHFGPELQFGHVVGDALDSEVLLVKTAWGGKSLYEDFRPPSSSAKKGKTGPYYTMMINQVREAIANAKKDFPKSKAVGTEIVGFVWYHGWNDGCDPMNAVPEYEDNLANLIRDVRKDLGVPGLPVVIGELTGPWVKAEGEWDAVRKAQAAVAVRPEFAASVVFVPTHDFVRKPEDSPNPGHGHHEFGNAETYFLVGDALGKGMMGLLDPSRKPVAPAAKPEPKKEAPKPEGIALGLDGVYGRPTADSKRCEITGIVAGSTEAGPLKIGDVLRGVHGKPFKEDAVGEFTRAVADARGKDRERNIRIVHVRGGIERTLDFRIEEPPPDLTKGGKPTDIPPWNLGPTGARGWIFGREFDTSDARQILVKGVEKGSPAASVLAEGDIILGLNGEAFTSDARVALGNAITEAEKVENKGQLHLLRWRAGEEKAVTVKLRVMGSYSDSSPYDCDKARKIVEAGCRSIAKRGLKLGTDPKRIDDWNPDIPTAVNALALLASGKPEYLNIVRPYARAIAPKDLELPLVEGMFAWSWSYANLFACEYYLATKDQAVLPAIREYSVKLARGQSLVGTWGHGLRVEGNHGTLGGYGAVNQTGLICWMSLALAQKCGIDDPDVNRAVDLSRAFFGFYAGKGSVPYGDHPPYWIHDDNGKSASAAMTFDILNDATPARFFTRMATAAHGEKELGHTGNYFGYLWGALAANRAGPEASAAFLKEQRWFYDLARKWDGSFFTNERDNYNWDMTGVFVLHAAMPLRTLTITGKDVREENKVTGDALRTTIASGRDFSLGHTDDACVLMSTSDLLKDLADWSPSRRQRAARALSERPAGDILPTITAMLTSDSLDARYGACLACQYMEEKSASATDALIAQLSHKDMWLRVRAGFALASIGKPAMKAVPELLRRTIAKDPADPRGMEAKYMSFALFRADFIDQVPSRRGLLAESLKGVDRELAYPAIRRMLTSDDGLATMSVRSIFRTLSVSELEPLLPEIVGVAKNTTPSGEMFAHEIRVEAFRFLAKNKIKAGLPVLVEYVTQQNGWGNRTKEVLPLLKDYGSMASETLPALRQLVETWKAKEAAQPEDGVTRSSIANDVILAIEQAVASERK